MNPRRLREALRRAYLTVDGRSLALLRVMLASVLIVDALRRVRWLRDLYSNAGLLPNHTMLWRPPAPRVFSLFFMASRVDEAAVLLALCLVCFFFLLVGWRTRLFHVLSFAMTTSLHSRVIFAENASAVALAVLMFWTAFLPLGRRYSVDALLASLRAGKAEEPEDLAARHLPPPDTRPAVSLAVLGFLLQLAAIYWFNYAHKSGTTWREGTAVHYVLHQERIVTWLGVLAREHLPFAATRAATYGTLVIEAAAPLLLLTPVLWRYTRALAVVLLTGLHGAIALMANLGIFSPVMICFYPLLVDGKYWDWLGRRRRAAEPRLVVFYDAGCGVCFQVVRVLARLDALERIAWRSNRDSGALPADVDPALLERTVLAVDSHSGRRWTRSDAFARVLGALPLGFLLAWPFYVPGPRWLAGLAYDAFARRRATISVWLGLAACAIPEPGRRHPAGAVRSEWETPASTPLRAWARRALPWLREGAVAFGLFVLGADLSVTNLAMPQALVWHGRPEWMAEAVMYPRLYENWGMFSPDGPRFDEMMVVDAVTEDGRHVDPYADRLVLRSIGDEGPLPERYYRVKQAREEAIQAALLTRIERHSSATRQICTPYPTKAEGPLSAAPCSCFSSIGGCGGPSQLSSFSQSR